MRPMIEPAAGRLFDIYYQYTSKEDLAALQSLTEEAYKLHERLRKLSAKSKGLFDINEFLLLKALRNYSVHRDDFVGKAHAVKRQFAEQHRLELQRVCLIDKKVVRLAINAEEPLEFGEQEKVSKINQQLVDFGEFYNIEPVIFNFMVKVYEKLLSLKLEIPGNGFAEIDKSYKNEIYHNFPHYVNLQSVNVTNEEVLSNITPLAEINIKTNKGLPSEEEDLFNLIASLDIDYAQYAVINYDFEGDSEQNYQAMHNALLDKILNDAEILKLARFSPNHIGLAFVTTDSPNKPSNVTSFNISKQRHSFNEAGIELDSVYYETTAYELLVLFINDGQIFPVIIYKDSLFQSKRTSKVKEADDRVHFDLSEYGVEPFSINVPNVEAGSSEVKVGRNDPCPCGSGKKYKKCCLH